MGPCTLSLAKFETLWHFCRRDFYKPKTWVGPKFLDHIKTNFLKVGTSADVFCSGLVDFLREYLDWRSSLSCREWIEVIETKIRTLLRDWIVVYNDSPVDVMESIRLANNSMLTTLTRGITGEELSGNFAKEWSVNAARWIRMREHPLEPNDIEVDVSESRKAHTSEPSNMAVEVPTETTEQQTRNTEITAEARREADMHKRDLDAAQSVAIADSDLVYVAKSDIGGLGVFAKQFIPKGTRITTYEGRWIQPSFPIGRKTQLDTHVLSLSAMDALDGIRYPEAGKGVGSLVNSSRGTGRKASARFITINEVLNKSAYLRATSDIQPDTEILVNYNYV